MCLRLAFNVAKDDLELMFLPPLPCWDDWHVHPGLCHTRNGTQSFVHTKQVLCLLSHTPVPHRFNSSTLLLCLLLISTPPFLALTVRTNYWGLERSMQCKGLGRKSLWG